MPIKRCLASLVAVSLLPAGAIICAPPASAADLRFTASPKKVVVNQSYENVTWSVKGGDVYLVDGVDANLEHTATREAADFDFTFDGDTAGSFRVYDWERMGRYTVYGSAHDYDYNELSVASTQLIIKRASRSKLTASRSGRLVTLKAVTKRYDGGYPLWEGHRKATVTYQRYARGKWRNLDSLRVRSNGVTQLTVRKAKKSKYRVLVKESARVWSSKSRAVRR